MLIDSAKIFEIIGGSLINLQKIKKALGVREKKEMTKLDKEMKKLAKMSVTGLNLVTY